MHAFDIRFVIVLHPLTRFSCHWIMADLWYSLYLKWKATFHCNSMPSGISAGKYGNHTAHGGPYNIHANRIDLGIIRWMVESVNKWHELEYHSSFFFSCLNSMVRCRTLQCSLNVRHELIRRSVSKLFANFFFPLHSCSFGCVFIVHELVRIDDGWLIPYRENQWRETARKRSRWKCE